MSDSQDSDSAEGDTKASDRCQRGNFSRSTDSQGDRDWAMGARIAGGQSNWRPFGDLRGLFAPAQAVSSACVRPPMLSVKSQRTAWSLIHTGDSIKLGT